MIGRSGLSDTAPRWCSWRGNGSLPVGRRGRRAGGVRPLLALQGAGRRPDCLPPRLREALRQDLQRGRGRQTRREQAAARPEAEGPFTGPMEERERRAAIASVIRGLAEDQREVLVMKVWGGLTFAQIAQVLQVSANTAASRYRYARAKLREQLAEEFIG